MSNNASFSTCYRANCASAHNLCTQHGWRRCRRCHPHLPRCSDARLLQHLNYLKRADRLRRDREHHQAWDSGAHDFASEILSETPGYWNPHPAIGSLRVRLGSDE